MGLPMIQIVSIFARQLSKPVADMLLRYGKNHPGFRKIILIPVGRTIVRLTTRLQMKRLGLGEPSAAQHISESQALEQASEFVQQVVLFGISVSIFAGVYYYTASTAPRAMKLDEFEEYRQEQQKAYEELMKRVEALEAQNKRSLFSFGSSSSPSSPPSTTPSSSTAPSQQSTAAATPTSPSSQTSAQPPSTPSPSAAPTSAAKPSPTTATRPSFSRISSMALDSALNIVLNDEENYLVMCQGNSIGIEDAARFEASGRSLRFRPLPCEKPPRGIARLAEDVADFILGRLTWY